ncbi:MAG: response regulator transcription factor [Acutalibacteraceae bacterium]|nr:response regulator transcription factor [Acutalibacteraceae bacterium]
MAKILIVEDDVNIAKMLEVTLSIGGYESERCDNGKKAVDLVTTQSYDLVLLDVMLPDMDGFKVIEYIDKEETAVIFLTALQDVMDKVKGLKLGAEDYIVKPFETVELLARIEVVLRRKHKSNNVIHYGDITMNIDEHTVKKGDDYVSLTPKEFDILTFFLQNQDIALTRERLLATVWGYEFMGETRTVDIHVQQIRKKMGLHNKLVTIPKLGYRLERNN